MLTHAHIMINGWPLAWVMRFGGSKFRSEGFKCPLGCRVMAIACCLFALQLIPDCCTFC